ncbi:MAG TPA: adenylate/guanylate cyclase domain-containing protein [Acidimicrobiia bacterium]|nr:adenylate/guanylate cyclase domain-containing protein [Acidimicrobiia bacterium]
MVDQQDFRERVALNADIVGFSRLMADDLDATTAAMENLSRLVRHEVRDQGGVMVNFVGDNFMATFETATAAMKAAISITKQVEELNSPLPEGKWVRFRMGLDVGDMTVAGDQWFGDALNVAARIQALAPAGGIRVSSRVYRALDEPALRFRPVGKTELKGIPERVELYEYSDLPSGVGHAPAWSGVSLAAPTVAVLPMHVTGLPEDSSSLGEIFRSDLIHRLTGVPQLEVVDAAREGAAPARYMIELGVAHSEENVRIYARVIDVSRMTGVKAHRWTLPASEIPGRSDSMAAEVARSVEVDLIVGAPADLYADLDDSEAIEKIYLGWYHLTSSTREGWVRAVKLFGAVAESHPDQPYGHVLSAFGNWVGADNGWAADPGATLELARSQAADGLAVGDPTGMALAVEAAILLSEGNTDMAVKTMETVRIERPTCDVTFGLEGSIRRYLGQFDKSIDSLDVAMRLTGMTKPWYPTVKACSLYHGGQIEEAAATAETVLEFQPKNLEALLVLAASQKELGLERRARATAQLVRERFPATHVGAWIDSNPYQVDDVVQRWKADLASIGLV